MSKDAISFTKTGIKYPRNNQIGGDVKGILGILKSRPVTVDRWSQQTVFTRAKEEKVPETSKPGLPNRSDWMNKMS